MTISVRFSVSAILPHLAGVSSGGLRQVRGRFVDGDESGAQALDLFLRRGADVGRGNDGAEAPRRGDRLQPGDTRAHHQHPRCLDRPGCGHHHGKGAAEFGSGVEDRFVPGEVGL